MIIITTNIQYIYLQLSFSYIISLKSYNSPHPYILVYTLIHSHTTFRTHKFSVFGYWS